MQHSAATWRGKHLIASNDRGLTVLYFVPRSTVGTLFALPWYLTWFGHSLNSYRSVVRLYDYFLASDFLLPIYVTSAIVIYRQNEIFQEDCDMASLHCLLSQVGPQLHE